MSSPRAVVWTALLLTLVASVVHPLTVDLDSTNEVREAAAVARLSDGELAIVVRGAATAGRREAILKLVASDDSSLALYYHKKSEKVTLESTEDGDLKAVWWEVRRPHVGTLVLVVSARGVLLYAGCRKLHWHAAPARRDLLRLMSHHALKVYHEADAPLEVYSTEEAALDALGCETSDDEKKKEKDETQVESDMVDVKDMLAKEKEMQDARNKREDRDQPANVDDYINNYIAQQNEHRGDQPSRGFESCDEALIRELIRLRQTIDGLRGDIADQKAQLDALRQKQDQCCRARDPAPPPRCSSGSCYPGY